MTPTWSRACEVFPHWRNYPPSADTIARTRLSLERDVDAFTAEMFRETGDERARTRSALRRMIPQLRVFRRLVLEEMRERAVERRFLEAAE